LTWEATAAQFEAIYRDARRRMRAGGEDSEV
jgi:hypothetical protein